MWDNLDRLSSKKNAIQRAPFGWPGGKSKSVDWLLDHLPQTDSFIDVFGGSGIVTLNKAPTGNDVFNDINSGVVALYRCLRNHRKKEDLKDWIELTIHSYEDWVLCKESWNNVDDDVERAGRWLYMVQYSFASQGRAFGFGRTPNKFSGKLHSSIKCFDTVHTRFRNVTVENQDWRDMLRKYDHEGALFYLDPPYPESDMKACYGKNVMPWDEHQEMLETIQTLKGRVALSGYSSGLYESYPWSERHTSRSLVTTCKAEHGRVTAEEVLWVK